MSAPLNPTIVKPSGNPIRITAAGSWICRNFPIKISEAVWSRVSADDSTLVVCNGTAATDANTIVDAETDTGEDRVVFSKPQVFSNLHVVTLSAGILTLYLE